MHHTTRARSAWLAATVAVSLTGSACGDKKSGGGGDGGGRGPVATVFEREAQKQKIPLRYLYAVAFSASGMQAQSSTVLYPRDKRARVVSDSDTLFGLSPDALGLTALPEDATFEAQVPAYAAHVRAALDDAKLKLAQNPLSLKEKYDWVWNLAQVHHPARDEGHELQTIWAKEVIDALNKGRRWQDPATGEVIALTPEAEPIKVEDMPPYMQDTLQLYTPVGDIDEAQLLPLANGAATARDNMPRRIVVTHCPLSLSACLALQVPNASLGGDGVAMGAHYVIAPDDAIVSNPLQVARHTTPVTITNRDGARETVRDALVVMLTGRSGRYEEGKRVDANPLWFSKEQLIKLAWVVRKSCTQMAALNPMVDVARCRMPAPEGTVEFRQASGATYRFGDIPDFSEDIFGGYLRAATRAPGQAEMQWRDPNKTFSAGRDIGLTLKFMSGVTNIDVQQAKRCPNGKLAWERVTTAKPRQTDKQELTLTVYGRGPNGNGQHYFRALMRDAHGELAAWVQDGILVRNYEEADELITDARTCQGT